MASQDTAELAFEDCRVPASNLLGMEGGGFMMLMKQLQQERLVVAIGAQAAAEAVLKDTVAYTQERKAFGRPILTTSLKSDDEILEYFTDASEIYDDYQKLVDIVIDGGNCGNVPSTVIDCTNNDFDVLREGAGTFAW